MKPHRGVSEILATMIVLMIVSSLGVMLYNISTSTLSSQQSNLLSQVETQKETTLEKFEIVSITRTDNSITGNSTIQIYYLDYGNASPIISSVYLEGTGKLGASHHILTKDFQFTRKEFNVTQYTIDNKPTKISYLTFKVYTYLLNEYYVTYKIVSQRGISIESQV